MVGGGRAGDTAVSTWYDGARCCRFVIIRYIITHNTKYILMLYVYDLYNMHIAYVRAVLKLCSANTSELFKFEFYHYSYIINCYVYTRCTYFVHIIKQMCANSTYFHWTTVSRSTGKLKRKEHYTNTTFKKAFISRFIFISELYVTRRYGVPVIKLNILLKSESVLFSVIIANCRRSRSGYFSLKYGRLN